MKNCIQCTASFSHGHDEAKFLHKMQHTVGDYQVDFPEPTLCPNCRQQTRTAHRNERHLYHRKGDLNGAQIIALYPPEAPWGAPYKVYSPEEWHSDSWNSLDYGREFDFSRSFFQQFKDLHKEVPRISLVALGNENSPYTTGTGYCKNCHLINSSEYCEDCYYGKLLQNCLNCIDCSYAYDSELCYQCFDVRKCYSSTFLSHSQNCSDCWFSENLNGCDNCFLCADLHQKRYCLRNRQLTKEDYFGQVNQYRGSHKMFSAAREELMRLRERRIHKYALIVNSDNCSGDFIKNSRNCLDCYDLNDSEDCRYVNVGVNIRDCYDCSNMYIKSELNYQVLGTIEAFHCAFTLYAFHSRDIFYSEMIFHSHDLFGCAGMKRNEYCILNKQYTKSQYEKLVPEIIEYMKTTGEWGQFFPPRYSPHPYEDTLAYEYFPLTREEIEDSSWNWMGFREKNRSERSATELPDLIALAPKDICSNVLICKQSGAPYKVMPQELRFYQKQQIPIPRLSPDQRYDQRMSLRNPRKLYHRKCDSCTKQIQTPFTPERKATVYCESCYLAAVY